MRRTWAAPLVAAALTAGLAGCAGPSEVGDGGPDGMSNPDAVGRDAVGQDAVGRDVVGTDAVVGTDGGAGYTEPVCAEPLASLADLASAYQNTPAGLRAAAQGIADRRYPIARAFVDVQSDMQLQTWFTQRNTFADVLNNFEVAAHEGQHIWDLGMISTTWPYRLRDDLVIRPRRLTNFNRSEILTVHVAPAMDQYARVYLMGSSGAQGFNTLLDEYTAYVHSIAARYCTRDGLPRGQRISSRDGILTFMYYVGTYLRLARTNHPADYAAIRADPEHVRLILTNWARAEFWLNITASHPELGLNDAVIRTWAYDPANVAEIDMLR